MNESRKNQVSLRGASAKEITRDALLDRVNQEREIRNYARRAKTAALLIQRAWRRHHATESAALQLREEWEMMMNSRSGSLTGSQMSMEILRPFLFFINYLSVRHGKIGARDRDCMMSCFRIVLEHITSKDLCKSFCAMAIGSIEERRLWFYQSKELISVCVFVLSLFDYSRPRAQDAVLTSTAMRLSVILTDPKGWNCIPLDGQKTAYTAVRNLVKFVGSKRSRLYGCIRKFILTLEAPFSSKELQTDDRFVIVASVITLSLRPFHLTNIDINEKGVMESAIQQYCISLLTIPWFPQRIPAILVPALRHKSVLSPCLRTLLILKEKILKEISEMDQLEITSRKMPHVGWALANTVCLATESDTSATDSGKFTEGLDYSSYLHVVILFADNFLVSLENSRQRKMKKVETEVGYDPSAESFLDVDEKTCGFPHLSYLDLFRPICQQWHLKELLASEKGVSICENDNLSSGNPEYSSKHGLLEIAYYYSCMLRLFSTLGPPIKSLPVLNMLSFTPGFLRRLWGELEKSLFHDNIPIANTNLVCATTFTGDRSGGISGRRQKSLSKETSNKWVNMLHKITGRSPTENDPIDLVNGQTSISQIEEHPSEEWDIESLRQGPEGISKDISCLLLLFCSSYSHLLLVLDDIEFYDKQVPFTLEQQQKITSMLNTLAYNSLSRGISPQYRGLVDSAVRCLHLLYERNSRRQFCHHSLWLAPGKSNRMPIAVAARTHEVFTAADGSPSSSTDSVITTMPHIFPFEERVKMFREFISMDKVSRRLAGEGTGPGSRSIEIVARRGHIFEDGLQQLNSLGSRLKSSIHVSFVSESGLPEAGLDYGGLSKEFLTDLSKVAFSPEYGLFSQTSTADRHLIPNTTARLLDNIMQMFEFLGRIVGKALYEGILLDFYFSHVFVQKLLGRYSFLDELSTLDPELYRNLMYVKHYDGDVRDLVLDFTVTEESLGKRLVIELKPGGKDICVTNDNKLQYVHAMADYKLNRQILPFSNAFYRGLTDLISPSWLKLFNASEFNQLLSGGDRDIDVDDLRKHTQYTGGYSEGSRTVKLFWEVFAAFEPKERCMLLKFVTSCSRAPLLGFKHLHPAFTIHKVNCDAPLWASFGGPDVDRLPSASTCYNTLKLPTYKRSSTLRAKLLYAINSNAGFELS
ncbi:E3 ubiquitin-protein ligase UPL7 [Salvia miltiorrhiza]|uniref:E3 ubiquitin-protein ligase UPL7 n=1 Tax=Salvia miltiorrhiza TaxID=226208 RepID=UPI0025AD8B03|nr:E3 ubiquitin-protein ligase UPL7 [Salvia miltiorrhiza]XP_057785710.1 E3 ubiquitin-protein ligase UPL7 [Salvia miltiorrhiza]XP_057785711.1 E3 ubiquitin-protein ligase UPL7 [Salvia miltiorrhiza]XP_057785712.1 E3 ubiquitin-protein ligase UPL7 [Salvia miltiorrhiza]XP_057785713.1 E3 ubiquitin-protein ligase UPL7 [Salvia miltiorrhiza]XP_057785714.1 E3 ubiquitin-protein ligase UPL7 [Salvia miltiorrhiza]